MIVALVTDLLDRSRFPAGVTFARDPAGVHPSASTVVVDLGRAGALEAVRRLRAEGSTARIIGYGSHVERDVLAEARTAGCDRVLARSSFFADVERALAP